MGKRKTRNAGLIGPVRLARELGVSRECVRLWRRHPGWTFGDPPWRRDLLPAVRTWRVANIGDDRAAANRAVWGRARKRRDTGAAPTLPMGEPGLPAFRSLVAAVARRFSIDGMFWCRAIVGLVEALDRGAMVALTDAEIEALRGATDEALFASLAAKERAAIARRAASKTLPLADREAVQAFLTTGRFAHLPNDDARQDAEDCIDAAWKRAGAGATEQGLCDYGTGADGFGAG